MTAQLEIGSEYDVRIDSVGAKGDGVTKIDGMIVFVPGSEQGDVHTVRITNVKEKFAFAEIVD